MPHGSSDVFPPSARATHTAIDATGGPHSSRAIHQSIFEGYHLILSPGIDASVVVDPPCSRNRNQSPLTSSHPSTPASARRARTAGRPLAPGGRARDRPAPPPAPSPGRSPPPPPPA